MKKLVLLISAMALLGSASAKVPSGTYSSSEVAKATAEAIKDRKAVAYLLSNSKSS